VAIKVVKAGSNLSSSSLSSSSSSSSRCCPHGSVSSCSSSRGSERHNSQPMDASTAWEGQPYLDRIWHAKQLPWKVRQRLLELHQEGRLDHEELSPGAIKCLASSGVHAEEGLQLLDKFCRMVRLGTRLPQHMHGQLPGGCLWPPCWRGSAMLIEHRLAQPQGVSAQLAGTGYPDGLDNGCMQTCSQEICSHG
jgi:hypothetical protein